MNSDELLALIEYDLVNKLDLITEICYVLGGLDHVLFTKYGKVKFVFKSGTRYEALMIHSGSLVEEFNPDEVTKIRTMLLAINNFYPDDVLSNLPKWCYES